MLLLAGITQHLAKLPSLFALRTQDTATSRLGNIKQRRLRLSLIIHLKDT
jgi:hypothetical protein